jgi:hypothetical protein
MKDWAKHDFRVEVLTTGGSGLVNSLNLAIAESAFDWIARFDVDDIYSPVRLRQQRKLIDEKPVAIFSDYEVISLDGESHGAIPSPVTPFATSLSLLHSQRTAHPSSLFSKSAFYAAGKYRTCDFPAEDLSLWLRMSRIGNLISVPEILLQYKVNPNSVTSTNKAAMIKKRNELIETIGISPIEMDRAIFELKSSFQEYKKCSFKNEREILMGYDLYSFLKLGNVKKTQIWRSFFNSLSYDFSLISSGYRLYQERLKRRPN